MPTKSTVKRHRHINYEDRIERLEKQYRDLEQFTKKRPGPILTIYSADGIACIEHDHKLWHRIVCKYEGDRCIGTPNPHWFSQWEITASGFSLVGFLDHNWKGWHGQYTTSELRYDELPMDILTLHINALRKHIASLSYWLPCHIYNDMTNEVYRP